jgi:hypothetical protein
MPALSTACGYRAQPAINSRFVRHRAAEGAANCSAIAPEDISRGIASKQFVVTVTHATPSFARGGGPRKCNRQ